MVIRSCPLVVSSVTLKENAGKIRSGLPGDTDLGGSGPVPWKGDVDEATGVAITPTSMEAEISQFWDDHFDLERLQEVGSVVNVAWGSIDNVDDLKAQYVDRVLTNLRPIFKNLRKG